MPYRQRILLANSKPSLTAFLETLLDRHPAHADFTIATTLIRLGRSRSD